MTDNKPTKFLFIATYSAEALVEKTMLQCLKHGIEVVRINIEDFVPHRNSIFQLTIMDHDVLLKVGKKQHFLSEFSVVWKRRISDNFMSARRIFGNYGEKLHADVTKDLILEVYEVRDLLLHCAANLSIPIVNDYDPSCGNKPFQSIKAAEFGLQTPSILVSNSSAEISSFVGDKPSITKPLRGFGYIREDPSILTVYTTSVDQEYLDGLTSEPVFPSFLQERVKSKYELKCIMVGDELYCIKQYSIDGGDIPTTDIKKSLSENKIKKMQYHLDPQVAEKVVRLCHYYKLDLCTLDLIYSDEEGYTFIEINPDGIVEYYGTYLDKPIHLAIFQMLKKKAGLPVD